MAKAPGNPIASLDERALGVLLHITSLPGSQGCGDLGPGADRFLGWLTKLGARWWQMLPITPADRDGSPYASGSAFAGYDALISLDALVSEGLLEPDEAQPPASLPRDRVSYAAVQRYRRSRLAKAFARFEPDAEPEALGGFRGFRVRESHWLDDWCLFAALSEAQGGKPWTRWDRPIRLRNKRAMAAARRDLADRIDYHAFVQFVFDRQWRALRGACRAAGVGLIGDVPIFVGLGACDVWANPKLFDLDRDAQPKAVSGVPPDVFSKTGQLWGHPLYRWSAHARTGYAWWAARFRRTFEQFDAVRIDHFLGFARCWAVPASHKTAKHGRWRKGPGAAFFEAMHEALGDTPIIAEDLGLLTPQAAEMRDRFGFPGMRVTQFGFGEDDCYHAPHNAVANSVAYTGTHDNDTSRGWFRAAPPSERRRALRYTGGKASTFARDLVRVTLAGHQRLAVIPVQDLLGLDGSHRMNHPGTTRGNWAWRVPEAKLTAQAARQVRGLAELFGRTRPRPPAKTPTPTKE